MRAHVAVTIEPREDGGVQIHAQGTGIVLSSPNVGGAFADLGTALHVWWCETSELLVEGDAPDAEARA